MQFFSPRCQTLGASIMCHEDIFSCVSILFLSRGPHNISLGVMAIVVFALNRMSWARSRANLSIEFFKAFKQAANAASTIAFPSILAWVCTAINHRCKDTILWAMTHPMRGAQAARDFPTETSTASRMTRAQIGPMNDDEFPTLTLTQPLSLTVAGIFRTGDDRQALEVLTQQISRSSHTQPPDKVDGVPSACAATEFRVPRHRASPYAANLIIAQSDAHD